MGKNNRRKGTNKKDKSRNFWLKKELKHKVGTRV
jgi:hypothetical protein